MDYPRGKPLNWIVSRLEPWTASKLRGKAGKHKALSQNIKKKNVSKKIQKFSKHPDIFRIIRQILNIPTNIRMFIERPKSKKWKKSEENTLATSKRKIIFKIKHQSKYSTLQKTETLWSTLLNINSRLWIKTQDVTDLTNTISFSLQIF